MRQEICVLWCPTQSKSMEGIYWPTQNYFGHLLNTKILTFFYVPARKTQKNNPGLFGPLVRNLLHMIVIKFIYVNVMKIFLVVKINNCAVCRTLYDFQSFFNQKYYKCNVDWFLLLGYVHRQIVIPFKMLRTKDL